MNRKPADAIRQREETGRTVEEAAERAAKALGVRRDDLTVEVLDDGSRGVFGIGAREARVRVTVKEATGKTDRPAREPRLARGTSGVDRVPIERKSTGQQRPAADVARETSERLLALMGFEATVEVEDSEEILKLDVKGENLAGLIGKHGQTLAALEMLIGQMIGREILSAPHVEMDVEGYRERRRQALEALSRRTAARVLREKREIALDPMTPRERRIVHTTLQGHPGIATVSRGEGEVRRVVVILRKDERNTAVAGGPTSAPAPEREESPAGVSRTVNASQGRDRSRERFSPRGPRRRDRQSRQREYPNSSGPASGSAHTGRDRDGARTRSGSQARGAYAQGFGSGYGTPKRPTGRPEGLPSDEELEAEIQAHLEKVRNDRSARAAPDSPRAAPDDRSKGGAGAPPHRGDPEQ